MPETGSAPRGEAPLEKLIEAADSGDPAANRVLFERLYAELHRLAESQLRRMTNPNLTLGATTVLHEFYLAMSGRESTSFPDRSRFMAYAARAMRGLIINYVRDRRAEKRGGLYHLTALNTQMAEDTGETADELVVLDDAIEALARTESALAEIVDLKFFCGLSFAEIAELRGVSERTVQRDWNKARLFLHCVLTDERAS